MADKLFIQFEGHNRHFLALQGEQDYDKKHSRAINARRNGQLVELKFPNGYDETCMISDTSVVAKKIKVIKKAKAKRLTALPLGSKWGQVHFKVNGVRYTLN